MDIVPIMLLSILGVGLFCLFYGFFIELHWIKHREIVVRFPSSYGRVPCNGKRIVFFSDLHTGASTTERQLRRRMCAIMRENPDAIIFGGDLVEERTPLGDETFRAMVLRSLNALEAPLGKWAVLGNHDVEAPRFRTWTLSLLHEAGFTILENEGMELDGLPVWGFADALHDQPTLDPGAFSAIKSSSEHSANQTDAPTFSLYLVHEPDWFAEAKPSSDSAVVLSGHSHHGQVTFFGVPLTRPPMGKRHWRGFYRITDQVTQVVSAGLGTVHIHARFFARPDVVTLMFQENKNRKAKEIEIAEL